MTDAVAKADAPAWPAMSLAQAHAMLTQPGSPFEIDTIEIDGRPTRIWKNGPPTLMHSFMAGRMHGERTFIVHENERITFEAFARATLALAATFRSVAP
jgi:long-chain acyl-CoA synthetase